MYVKTNKRKLDVLQLVKYKQARTWAHPHTYEQRICR